eukprot:TRINITY_DN15784_c0_g1_i2.p1 TRINITY_DN15784_c0_g1~~TRINITY_DN15784_c0_g1_i2.p1  ORF type:complete len:105 (-),score=25.66 TRINITY_DN15784_c0_g1_i2:76-390(-)
MAVFNRVLLKGALAVSSEIVVEMLFEIILGPMDSMDANEAEVYALLIGSHELEKIGGSHHIIEGDSTSAIQWASGKATYPWRIADWAEEVQDLSRKTGASFRHI